MQSLDAGIGLFEHDLGKGAGPLLSSSDFVDTKQPFELEICSKWRKPANSNLVGNSQALDLSVGCC
jgi:hypothetical protein